VFDGLKEGDAPSVIRALHVSQALALKLHHRIWRMSIHSVGRRRRAERFHETVLADVFGTGVYCLKIRCMPRPWAAHQ
jgi:hypothetical protein